MPDAFSPGIRLTNPQSQRRLHPPDECLKCVLSASTWSRRHAGRLTTAPSPRRFAKCTPKFRQSDLNLRAAIAHKRHVTFSPASTAADLFIVDGDHASRLPTCASSSRTATPARQWLPGNRTALSRRVSKSPNAGSPRFDSGILSLRYRQSVPETLNSAG